MLPGIYGFQFDAGHIIFLGVFYTVLTIIAITVFRALLRSRRDLRIGREPAMRWSADFHDLPERCRSCRHELTGEVAHRECPNGFNCRGCAEHARFDLPDADPRRQFEVLGVAIPLDRQYHRGHTWVRDDGDGTFTVGLDALAARLMGDATPELPEVGTKLSMNGPAWTMKSGGDAFRILAPVGGTVVATSDGSEGWLLKIDPGIDVRTTHLLAGREVEAWMRREVERLEAALASTGVGVALADGGSLVDDPGGSYPSNAWADARAEFLLQP